MSVHTRSIAHHIVFGAVFALLFAIPLLAFADLSTEQRAALQAQLDQIERDISNNKGSLSVLQRERTTLERDIQILDNKIKTAQLQIKQTDLTLTKIGTDISSKRAAIAQVDARVARGEASLAQLLRRTREIDDVPFVEIALSKSASDFFEDIDSFEQYQRALGLAFEELSEMRDELADKKSDLEEKHVETQQVRTAQEIAKQKVLADEKQKKTILTVTKGQEKTYQQIIADKQKQADAIRAALFGLRDSGAIPFGTAYEYAKAASTATGVSAALILAILTQESNLGVNVGSCFITNIDTGAGVGKNTGRTFSNAMKAPRDTVPFKEITEALGKDWSSTPVSCPQSVGYGGAMGPSQFIPSTWMLYKNRLSTLTGDSMPNPWNAQTAVYATALYMSDLGADAGTRASERTAACKYFSGRSCTGTTSVYGDSVMDHRDEIQAQIDIIK